MLEGALVGLFVLVGVAIITIVFYKYLEEHFGED